MLALAWTDPTSAPPGGNVAAPINVGSTDQVKNGGLGVNSLAVFGNSLFGGSAGSNAYLNFGATFGSSGYGIRDNAGILEFKNNGGSWDPIQTVIYNYCQGGACGGAGPWTVSGNNIYNNSSANVGIGTASPGYKLDVNGAVSLGNSDIYFTKTTHNHTGIGNAAGFAAIENASNYNTLMILGRSGGLYGVRSVSIWDRLDVNGTLDVHGSICMSGDCKSSLAPQLYIASAAGPRGTSAICPAGYTVSGCAGYCTNMKSGGNYPSGNGCAQNCDDGTLTAYVYAYCIK
jgi:hypothetical protein